MDESRFFIEVKSDFLEEISKAKGRHALEELIWNALDADATHIDVCYNDSELGGYASVVISDNGHGLKYEEVRDTLGNLGGSIKKRKLISEQGRIYHGKYGKGRFKAFALGNHISFVSRYVIGNELFEFDVIWDINDIKNPRLGAKALVKDNDREASTVITIRECNTSNVADAFSEKSIDRLVELLAGYIYKYPGIVITIQGIELDFEQVINNQHSETRVVLGENDSSFNVEFRVVEWRNKRGKNLIYFCNSAGISISEQELNIRKTRGLSLAVFAISNHIQSLSDNGTLELDEMSPDRTEIVKNAREIAKNFVARVQAENTTSLISDLKKNNIYPFKHDPSNEIELLERRMFDDLVFDINEYHHSFSKKHNEDKKITLELVKVAIEEGNDYLKHVLTEVLSLSEDKVRDFSDLMMHTSLSNIIDTMKTITNRLQMIHELRTMIFDKKYKSKTLERRQLHKVVRDNTWIFGDDFTYGVDDANLKNVLKAHLEFLGREDFEEITQSQDNSELRDIPDICLWRQFPCSKSEHRRNLVIELKRPSKVRYWAT